MKRRRSMVPVMQKIRHIDLPSILPIAVMMLILNCGSIMGGDTQKALLLQTGSNTNTSDIIGVYVYNVDWDRLSIPIQRLSDFPESDRLCHDHHGKHPGEEAGFREYVLGGAI